MIAWPLPRSCTRFEGGGHRHRPQRTAAISRTASTTRWMVGVSRVEWSHYRDRTCCTTECSPNIPPIDYTQEKWTGLTFQTISAFRTYMCKRLFCSVSCFVATRCPRFSYSLRLSMWKHRHPGRWIRLADLAGSDGVSWLIRWLPTGIRELPLGSCRKLSESLVKESDMEVSDVGSDDFWRWDPTVGMYRNLRDPVASFAFLSCDYIVIMLLFWSIYRALSMSRYSSDGDLRRFVLFIIHSIYQGSMPFHNSGTKNTKIHYNAIVREKKQSSTKRGTCVTWSLSWGENTQTIVPE